VIFTLPPHSTRYAAIGCGNISAHEALSFRGDWWDNSARINEFQQTGLSCFLHQSTSQGLHWVEYTVGFQTDWACSIFTKSGAGKGEGLATPRVNPSTRPFSILLPYREIQKLGTELQDDLDDYDISEELREKFGRYIKGSLVGASSLALAERDIEATHNHSKAKAKRDKLGGSVAQKGGVITVRQARGKITAGVEEERKKRVRASEREEKRDANARIKWNQAIAKGFKLTSSGVDQQLGRCFRCRIRGWGFSRRGCRPFGVNIDEHVWYWPATRFTCTWCRLQTFWFYSRIEVRKAKRSQSDAVQTKLGHCVVVKAAVQSFHPRRHATTPFLTATTHEED